MQKGTSDDYELVKNTTDTDFIDENLEIGMDYNYAVSAYILINGVKVYDSVVEFGDITILPEAPTYVKVEQIAKDELRISWDAVLGADGYIVYKKKDLNEELYTRVANTQDTYCNEIQTHGGSYYYYVLAYVGHIDDRNYTEMCISEKVTIVDPYQGWFLDNRVWYYYKSKDNLAIGWEYIDGSWYYFNDKGKMLVGWINDNENMYYLNSSGAMTTDWQYINGAWYYMNSSGAMCTGWLFINNVWYYFDHDGKMAIGWKNINSNWYYFNTNGEMVTGWLNLGGIWYYLNENGSMITGWQFVNGAWYYFNNDGDMAVGWLNLGGIWYYLYSDGSMATGWVFDNNVWYLLDSSGAWIGYSEPA